MRFPGYISIERNSEGFVELYFFKGIDENSRPYYQNINEDNIPEYEKISYDDGAIKYIFKNKNLSKISCELIPVDSQNEIKEIITKI